MSNVSEITCTASLVGVSELTLAEGSCTGRIPEVNVPYTQDDKQTSETEEVEVITSCDGSISEGTASDWSILSEREELRDDQQQSVGSIDTCDTPGGDSSIYQQALAFGADVARYHLEPEVTDSDIHPRCGVVVGGKAVRRGRGRFGVDGWCKGDELHEQRRFNPPLEPYLGTLLLNCGAGRISGYVLSQGRARCGQLEPRWANMRFSGAQWVQVGPACAHGHMHSPPRTSLPAEHAPRTSHLEWGMERI